MTRGSRSTATPLAGADARAAPADRRSARLPGAPVLRRRARDGRLDGGPIVQINHTRHGAARHRARPAFPAPAARRDQARQLPARRGLRRRGRPAARLADVPALARRAAERPTTTAPADSRGLRPRLPDADRRLRAALSATRPPTRRRPRAGLNALDPRLAIAWPLPLAALSARDAGHRRCSTPTSRGSRAMKCRHCGAALGLPFLDLGSAPPSNAYLTEASAARAGEMVSAARAGLRALLAGADRGLRPAARSCSTPTTPTSARSRPVWLAHAERYVAAMAARFGLDAGEPRRRGRRQRRLPAAVRARRAAFRALGVEPTASTAAAARAQGPRRSSRTSSASRSADELAAAGPAGRPDRRQQRAGPRARHQRLRRRLRAAAQARRASRPSSSRTCCG